MRHGLARLRYAAQFFAVNQSLIQATAIDGIPLWKEPLSSPSPGRVFGPVSVLNIRVLAFALASEGLLVGVYEDGIPFASTSLALKDAVGGTVPLYPTCAPAVIGTRVYVLATSSNGRPASSATCAVVALDMRESLAGRLRQVWAVPYNCSVPGRTRMGGAIRVGDPANPLMALSLGNGTGTVVLFGGEHVDDASVPTMTAVLDPTDATQAPRVVWRTPVPATLRTMTLSTNIAPCANTSTAAAPRSAPPRLDPALTVWATFSGSATMLLVDVASGEVIKHVDVGALAGAGAAAVVSSAHVLAAPCTPGGGVLVMAISVPADVPAPSAACASKSKPCATHPRAARSGGVPGRHGTVPASSGNVAPVTLVLALDGTASAVRWRVPLPHGGAWSAWSGRFSVITPTPPHADDGASVLVMSGHDGVLAIGVV